MTLGATRDVARETPRPRLAEQLLDALGSRHALWVIFGIFIGVRVAIMAVPTVPFSDAMWYLNRAREIANGHGYAERGVATAFWPVGWPGLLGGLFSLFGVSVLSAQLFNLACACLGAWLTLDLGRRMFLSELAGRAGLLIVALYPNHAAYTALLWTEVFYSTLVLAGCWLLMARRSLLARIGAGLVFGVSMLVKAQSLLLIPLIFLIAALRDGGGLRAWFSNARHAATVLVVALLVVFPWTLRNHSVFGEWVLVSTNGGFTLLTGNNPSARGGYTPDDPMVLSVPRSVATQVTADREYKRRALAWISEHPLEFVALMPRKLFLLWAVDGEAEHSFQAGFAGYDEHWLVFRSIRWLNQLYYAAMLVIFVAAGWLLFSGRRRIDGRRTGWWLLPYAVAAYPSLIAIVFSGQSRFHYPVMPFVAMVCGWWLVDRLNHGFAGRQIDVPTRGVAT